MDWTSEKYKEFCKDLAKDVKDEELTDEEVFDLAKDTIQFNPDLKKFMEEEMRVTDCIGRLANDI